MTVAYHCDETKVALLLEIRLDRGKTPTSRLANSLDEETFTNSEFNTDIIRAKLKTSQFSRRDFARRPTYSVNTEVNCLQQTLSVTLGPSPYDK